MEVPRASCRSRFRGGRVHSDRKLRYPVSAIYHVPRNRTWTSSPWLLSLSEMPQQQDGTPGTQDWESKDKLMDEALRERLKVSNERVVEQRERCRVARGNGALSPSKREKSLKYAWNHQNRKHAKNDASYQNHLKRQHDKYAAEKDNGKKKKKVVHRLLKRKKLYPAPSWSCSR